MLGVLASLFFWVGDATAVECRADVFEDHAFSVCRADPTKQDIRLFHTDVETGQLLGSFRNLSDMLGRDGARLLFAMNAGMYHADRSPVGLFVEAGDDKTAIVTADGPGNFGLLPNGVFCIREKRADVIETRDFVRQEIDCQYASQSGPMLVIDGALHPRFLPQSDSLFVRNGVGTSADGRDVFFVISQEPLNFHTFARIFRDHLTLPNALYFDGKISKLYAPELNRQDGGFPMGPMVGVVDDTQP